MSIYSKRRYKILHLLVIFISTLHQITLSLEAEVGEDVGANSFLVPNVLIIGPRKTGTTALIKMLGLHPNVNIASNVLRKENIFYKDGVWHYESEILNRSMIHPNKINPNNKGSITVEKCSHCFSDPSVPFPIHSFNSSIKLILIVRHPVVRTISEYVDRINSKTDWKTYESNRQIIFQNLNPIPSFYQIFTNMDGDENKGDKSVVELEKIRKALLNGSYYAKHLKVWLKYFQWDQIFILDGDQLVTNPRTVLEKTCQFLSLNPQLIFDENELYFSKAKGFYCWKPNTNNNNNSFKGSKMGGGGTCLGQQKGRQHPKVTKKVLDKLQKHFKPFNEEFFKLVGYNFPAWNREML